MRTLRAETFFLLRDPNEERFSVIRVIEKLNDACLDYCLRTQLIKEEINIQLLQNQHEYDVKTRVEKDGNLRYFAFPIRVGYDGDDQPGVMPGSLLAIDLKGYRRDLSGMPYLWYLCAVSPGKIQIIGPPQEDGAEETYITAQDGSIIYFQDGYPMEDVSPDSVSRENKNLQVSYIAMPIPMEGEYLLAEDGSILYSENGHPLEPETATVFSYPDSIPAFFHKFLPYGAAAMILEEGDKNDLLKAREYEAIFYRGITEQVAEEYRARTVYDDFRPL